MPGTHPEDTTPTAGRRASIMPRVPQPARLVRKAHLPLGFQDFDIWLTFNNTVFALVMFVGNNKHFENGQKMPAHAYIYEKKNVLKLWLVWYISYLN